MKKEELKKEIELILSKRREFKNFINMETVLSDESEFNYKNYTIRENIGRFITPFKISRNFKSKGISRIGNKDSNILFVNGICTSLGIANYQKSFLEKIFKEDVELIFNHSDGFFFDIYECLIDRTFEVDSVAAKKLADIIEEKIFNNNEIFIIGYSQGAIITASALKIISLKFGKEILKKIFFITFASGFKNYNINKIKAEHFINKYDPICQIGILSNKNNFGEKYINNRKGHLFIVDYLLPLINGEFGSNSIIYNKINKLKKN